MYLNYLSWIGTGRCTTEHRINGIVGIVILLGLLFVFSREVYKLIKSKKYIQATALFILGGFILLWVGFVTAFSSACV